MIKDTDSPVQLVDRFAFLSKSNTSKSMNNDYYKLYCCTTHRLAMLELSNAPVTLAVLFFSLAAEERRVFPLNQMCFLHGSYRGFVNLHCFRLTFAKLDVRLQAELVTFWAILALGKQLSLSFFHILSHYRQIISQKVIYDCLTSNKMSRKRDLISSALPW